MPDFRRGLWQRKTTLGCLATLLVVSMAHARPLTRDEVGELFIFGIAGPQLDAKTVQHLRSTCPGSILLFRRNLTSNRQTIELTQQLRNLHRECSSEPLLIGLDQEGGQVARIPLEPPMPSAWSVGVTREPKMAEELGFQVGQTLRGLGFNLNLAPVLDLGSGAEKTFIGTRSFGSDPEWVGRMGTSFSFGLIRSHVLPVAKHFPGMGSVPNDPHQVMVRRPASEKTLWSRDLLPFREFAELFPTGMMPSHLVYPQADRSAGPGTFSKTLISTWLRQKMNYRGLVISDDLLMKGVSENQSLSDNVVFALNAGVDQAMISWSLRDQARAVRAVFAALAQGRLREDVLREKIARIRKIKTLIGEPKTEPSGPADRLLLTGTDKYQELTYEILRRNLQDSIGRITLESPQRIFVWPDDIRLKWHLERALEKRVWLSSSPDFSQLRQQDLILAFVRNKREARHIANWGRTLKGKTIVVNQLEPGAVGRGYLSEFQVFLQHPMLAPELAKGLRWRWKKSYAAGP